MYGFDFNAYGDSARYAALLYATIVDPLASVGYLILFLLIEPHAYEMFLKIFLGVKSIERTNENSNTDF